MTSGRRSRPSAELPAELPTDVDGALRIAPELVGWLAGTGGGRTRVLWELLASLAATDLGVARAIEPHVDAAAILTQAGEPVESGAWGVFAAEGGPDPLTATLDDGRWHLDGTKPWCSLADRLDHALITARIEGGSRLFRVALRQGGVTVISDEWHARGLSEIPSGPVRFADVTAFPVREAGWYLTRPGFAWGGIGVAACWYGGAVGIARRVFVGARARPGELAAAHLGAVDRELQSARSALAEAADLIDEGGAERILAKRVRAIVAVACERILAHAAHALGPAPLAQEAEHAKRVADLELYIRQHHAERDLASLGTSLIESETAPW